MTKKYLLNTVKLTAVFAITLFLLWSLLYLSALIPNELIRENMEKSALSYKDRDAFEYSGSDRLNSVADHYSDSIWLNISWNMGKGDSLSASVLTNYYDGGELGENAGLYYTVFDGINPNTDYTRYWHGTAGIIRVLHLFTDVDGIKAIGFCTFILFALLSLFAISIKHPDIALILAVSLVLVQIWNIRLSMEYQPAFIIAFALIPFFLLLERYGNKYLVLLSVISGTVIAFFDFLTTETVTLLLPIALVVAIRAKENRLGKVKESLPLLIKCACSWICSYVGAFIAKWTVVSIVSGTNAFEAALSSAAKRIGGATDASVEKPGSFLSSVSSNISTLFGGRMRLEPGRALLGIILTALILLSLLYLFKSKKNKSFAALLLLGIGSTVLIRYSVLYNHSYIHCFFTYRALVTVVFSLLSAVWLNIEPFEKKRRRG